MIAVAASLWAFASSSVRSGPAVATVERDVQLVGLAPLYEALFAVANCPNLAIEQAAFAHTARLYHLAPTDLTSYGRFPEEIADLTRGLTLRLNDDRATFCSVNRLSFAVLHGVLVDGGAVFPRPLPFGPAYPRE